MTQPRRNRPRERVKPTTAQICCWIGADAKAEAIVHANARGEPFRAVVERALRALIAAETKTKTKTTTPAANS